MTSDHIQIDENLVLRSATPEDVDRVVELNEIAHGNPEKNELEKPIGVWTRDLFSGYNPMIAPSDFTVVEDISTAKIVSTICLMSQTWNIGGIETPMGMPEIVGTHPDYRRRGLVKKQFDLMHQWSLGRGQLFNTILGIPHYYRQFGYEYAIDAYGGSMTSLDLLKSVKPDEGAGPHITARDATRADAKFIADTYKNIHDRVFVSVIRSTAIVEKELFEWSEGSAFNWSARVFERNGDPIGCYMYGVESGNKGIRVDSFEIDSNFNWTEASRALLIDLQHLATVVKPEGQDHCPGIEFSISQNHPLYGIYKTQLGAIKNPYAWYVRVPDMAKLLLHLEPLFEQRLSDSKMRGFDGDVVISFYSDGVRMKFDSGKLVSAENTGYIERDDASARYPDLVFLKALFGQKSFSQLRELYPDCGTKDHAMATLQDILFGGPLPSAVLQVS